MVAEPPLFFSVFGRRHTHYLPEIPRKIAEIAYAAPVAFRFAKNTGLDSLAALSALLYRRKNCLVSDVKRLRHYITELMGIKEELRYGGTFALEHESVMESVQIVTKSRHMRVLCFLHLLLPIPTY